MAYVPPNQVTSPKDHWALTCVIYDEGEGGIAVSWGYWDDSRVLAIRWNGTSDPHKGLGNPQSSGHATWFIIPNALALSTLETLLHKQNLGNDSLNQECFNQAIQFIRQNHQDTTSLYEF